VGEGGNATTTALLVVDMISPYDHEDADDLAVRAAEAIEPLTVLAGRARESDVPVIYVNDNYGDWNSSADELAEHALQGRHPELVKPVLPREGDLFVIKARHSVFYQTPLEYLLHQLETERLVFAGQATEQCILYSALDAYVRHFDVVVARDACAAIVSELAEAALQMIERNMRGEIAMAAECRL
jgi:nicotinamidase-related amidase